MLDLQVLAPKSPHKSPKWCFLDYKIIKAFIAAVLTNEIDDAISAIDDAMHAIDHTIVAIDDALKIDELILNTTIIIQNDNFTDDEDIIGNSG